MKSVRFRGFAAYTAGGDLIIGTIRQFKTDCIAATLEYLGCKPKLELWEHYKRTGYKIVRIEADFKIEDS